MIFISYEEIKRLYENEENFIKYLINLSAGCCFVHGEFNGEYGIWYSYDYDSSMGS